MSMLYQFSTSVKPNITFFALPPPIFRAFKKPFLVFNSSLVGKCVRFFPQKLLLQCSEQNRPEPYEPSCSFPQLSHFIIFYLYIYVVVPPTTFLFTIIRKFAPKPVLGGTMTEWEHRIWSWKLHSQQCIPSYEDGALLLSHSSIV